MGLGRIFQRNLSYQVTGTGSHDGVSQSFEVVTDAGHGAWPNFSSSRAPYEGAMAAPGCWRAAILLSDLMGAVPYHAYREGPDDTPRRLRPAPSLLEQPAPPDPRMVTFSSWGLDLMWHGNAVGLIVGRNRDGWPTAVSPRSARLVDVKRAEPRDRLDVPDGTVIYRMDGQWRHWRDVVHVKGPCEPGALRGFGLLEAHLSGTVKLALNLAEQAGGVAEHAVPSMKVNSLDPNLDAAGAQALKDAVMRSQRTRQPLVLNPSTDVTPLSWNPTETQLIDARKLSLLEQALIFGLDPSWLGAAQTSRVYSNIEQEATNLIRYSAGGHLARIEQTLATHFPRGVWVEANLDAQLRADTLTRYRAHALAFGAWLTADEIRHKERLPKLTPAQREQMAPKPATGAVPGGSPAGDATPPTPQQEDDAA